MAWITLSIDDIKTRISDAEYSGVTSAALASDQDADTVVTEVVNAVIREIRGHVAANSKNVQGEGLTIPDELADAALAVIRGRIFTRLPGLKDLYDEVRQEETREAVRLFQRVAEGKFAIVPPETAAEEQAGGPGVELVASRTRRATPSQMSGL